MVRLTRFDVPDLVQPVCPPLVAQCLFAVLCTLVTILIRMAIDMALPGAGPFAVTVPGVLVATLFGRWQAGLITLGLCSLHAWYFVLPASGSFDFTDPSDGPRVAVNVSAGFFVVALAELFRRAVRRAMQEREVLLLELEHRVKNNFASIASVLRLQARDSTNPDTVQALQAAQRRVDSFSLAYSLLYHGVDTAGDVNMRAYLGQLCEALDLSLAADIAVRVECDARDIDLPRERAITIGLLVNEVATNSAKHAFPPDSSGVIRVRFEKTQGGYRLEVGDDGRGIPEGESPGGLGLKLIGALTDQAGARMHRDSGPGGTTYSFDLAP